MQPTHILACHSAYLQVISSINTSKKNPSTMMTSPMPMPILEYCDGIHHASRLWFVNCFLAHMLLLTNTFDTPDPDVCAVCPLHIFSTPWTLGKVQHLAAGSHFMHQSNPTHWRGMILDIVVLHRSIYTQIGELVFTKVDRIIYSLSSTLLATI